MGVALGQTLALGLAVGTFVPLGQGEGDGDADDVGIAEGVLPAPGGRNGDAGIPPFVLHAETATQSAVKVSAAKTRLSMAQ